MKLYIPPQLKRLAIAFAIFISLFLLLRHFLVPDTFGQYGFYRGASLTDNASPTIHYAGEKACFDCHQEIEDAKKEDVHSTIRCEACHGPGGEHIANGGDVDKIVSSSSADICGRCHSGNQSDNGGRWMAGYRPGMKLSDIAGLKLIPVDPEEIPPVATDIHPSLTYNMWLASGHSKAPSRKIQIKGKDWTGPISCVACHNPHYSDNPSQLAMKPEKLCTACHFQESVLRGRGAKGIEETKSLHPAIPCISCHMTEKNHLMKYGSNASNHDQKPKSKHKNK